MYNPEEIEKYAQKIYARYEYFNNYTLEMIARRIKSTGQLSAHDQQALKNIADITGDMDAITKKLAEITRQNISDVEKMYTQVVSDGVNEYKPLYDFKGMKFVPFEENEFAQALVENWAKQTSGEMINLSRTKAIGFDKCDIYGNVVGHTPLQGAYEQAISEAVQAVTSGTTDFSTAMSKTVERLGGSGVKVTYGSGVNRSLDAMVRQNLLYGAKQAAQSYDEHIGRELGCDGFEVDAHSGCRPSHEFMQGKMYSYGGKKIIDGITYEDGTDALKALGDYGCLHFKTDVILGVSVPRYSKEELERIHRETTELIEYDGREKTLYQWKQTQRTIERAVRKEETKANMLDAAGMKRKAQESRDRVKIFRDKYDDMCSSVKGLEPRLERMRVHKDKGLTNGGSGGIIKPYRKIDTETIPPMDEKRFNRIATNLEKRGIKVIQDADGDAYLAAMNAEAMTLSDGSAVIFQSHRVPSVSACFEEIIHTTQIRDNGMINAIGNKDAYIEYLHREIEANEKVLRCAKAYGLTDLDRKSVQRNLKKYKDELSEVK